MDSKLGAKFVSIISCWIRLHVDKNTNHDFPGVIRLIVNQYLIKPLVMKFSSKFKSGNAIKLSDDNKCATRAEFTNLFRPHVLIDDEPVKSGIHVWRFKVKILTTCISHKGYVFYTINRW